MSILHPYVWTNLQDYDGDKREERGRNRNDSLIMDTLVHFFRGVKKILISFSRKTRRIIAWRFFFVSLSKSNFSIGQQSVARQPCNTEWRNGWLSVCLIVTDTHEEENCSIQHDRVTQGTYSSGLHRMPFEDTLSVRLNSVYSPSALMNWERNQNSHGKRVTEHIWLLSGEKGTCLRKASRISSTFRSSKTITIRNRQGDEIAQIPLKT